MKKVFLTLFTVLLLLSLCACGNSAEKAPVQQELQDPIAEMRQNYPDVFDRMLGTWCNSSYDIKWFTVFEDGTLQLGDETLNWTVTDVNDRYCCLSTPDEAYMFFFYTDSISDYGCDSFSYYHGEDSYMNFIQLDGGPNERVVKITADNWKDFFEIEYVAGTPEKNAFGEFELLTININLRLREEYYYRVCLKDSHIAIEADWILSPARIIYDTNTETFSCELTDTQTTTYAAGDMFSFFGGESYFWSIDPNVSTRLSLINVWPDMYEGCGNGKVRGGSYPNENGIIEIQPMIVSDLSVIRIEGSLHLI